MNAFQQRYPRAGNPAAGKTREKQKDQKDQPMTSENQQLKTKVTTVRWTPYPPQKSYLPLVVDLWYQKPDDYDEQVYALSLLPRYAPGVAHVRRCDLRNVRTTDPQNSEALSPYTSRTSKTPPSNETPLPLLEGCGTPTLKFSHNATHHQESGQGPRGNKSKGEINDIIASNEAETTLRNYTHRMNKTDINEGTRGRLRADGTSGICNEIPQIRGSPGTQEAPGTSEPWWDIPSNSKDSEESEDWSIV